MWGNALSKTQHCVTNQEICLCTAIWSSAHQRLAFLLPQRHANSSWDDFILRLTHMTQPSSILVTGLWCEKTSWPRQRLQKKAFCWGLAYSFRGQAIIIMVGIMVACRQTWYRRSSWAFYILTHRQRERQREWDWARCGLLELQSSSPVTYFL